MNYLPRAVLGLNKERNGAGGNASLTMPAAVPGSVLRCFPQFSHSALNALQAGVRLRVSEEGNEAAAGELFAGITELVVVQLEVQAR